MIGRSRVLGHVFGITHWLTGPPEKQILVSLYAAHCRQLGKATTGGTGTSTSVVGSAPTPGDRKNGDPRCRPIGETSDGRTLAIWFSAGGRDSRRLATRQIGRPAPPWLGGRSP